MAALLASRAVVSLPALRCARTSTPKARLAVIAQAKNSNTADLQAQVTRIATLSTVASTFLAAGNAQAAQEVASLAAGDGRLGAVTLLLLPALGWVAFNILGPAQAQFKTMGKSAKGVAAGLGLTAAMLLAAQSADAAQEVSQLAAGDNRTGIIATLFVPVIGWVLFNILGPAQAQLDNMGPAKTSSKKRGVAAAIGAGASLLMVQQADAASEIAQVAAGDNRLGIIAFLFVPVVGWVLFNILGPAQAQLENMSGPAKKTSSKKRGVAAAIGAGAGMMLVQQADAASEIAQVAAGDNRLGIIAFLFVPVVGWVLFNILGPAQAQLDNMSGPKSPSKKTTKKR